MVDPKWAYFADGCMRVKVCSITFRFGASQFEDSNRLTEWERMWDDAERINRDVRSAHVLFIPLVRNYFNPPSRDRIHT